MFHKIKGVTAVPGLRLLAEFSDGTTKEYDVGALMEAIPEFRALADEELFRGVAADTGGASHTFAGR